MKKIFKELFILILLTAVIFFTLSMVFYDFFHNSQELPQKREYVADGTTKATIQEIDLTSGDNGGSDSLLKSYEIVAADLKNYEAKDVYEKGKVNPFMDYPTEQITVNETQTNSGTTDNTAANSSSQNTTQNTTTNTSTNQGTFFEEPNSK